MLIHKTTEWPRSRSVVLAATRLAAIWIAAVCGTVSMSGCVPSQPPPRPAVPNPLVVEFWIAASQWDLDPTDADPREQFEWHPIKDGAKFITAHARNQNEAAQWLDDPTGLRSRNLVVRRTASGGYELLMVVADGSMMRRDPERPWGVIDTELVADHRNEAQVIINLDPEGTRRLADLSERAHFPRERPIATLLNGEIVGASRFSPTRTGKVGLVVDLTEAEARDYRRRLQ